MYICIWILIYSVYMYAVFPPDQLAAFIDAVIDNTIIYQLLSIPCYDNMMIDQRLGYVGNTPLPWETWHHNRESPLEAHMYCTFTLCLWSNNFLPYLFEEVCGESTTLNGYVPKHPLLVGLLEYVFLHSALTHQPDIHRHRTQTQSVSV